MVVYLSVGTFQFSLYCCRFLCCTWS